MKKCSTYYFKKKAVFFVILILSIFIIGLVVGIIFRQKEKSEPKQKTAWEQLNADDQKIAGIYAELYDVSEERVANLKLDMEDWEEVNSKLDTEYFTIGETEKYQMSEDGYSLEDLHEAETLARKTGKRALDLAKLKGKSAEKKKWSEVLSDEQKDSIEEKLGLTKEQIRSLEKKKYSQSERIDIALLCFNRQEAFEEIMKKLESGQSIVGMKEETAHEK